MTLNLRTSPSSTELAGKKPAPRMAAESVSAFAFPLAAEDDEDEEELDDEEADMASNADGTSSFLAFFAPPLGLGRLSLHSVGHGLTIESEADAARARFEVEQASHHVARTPCEPKVRRLRPVPLLLAAAVVSPRVGVVPHAVSVARVAAEEVVGPADLHHARCEELRLVVPPALVISSRSLGTTVSAASNSATSVTNGAAMRVESSAISGAKVADLRISTR